MLVVGIDPSTKKIAIVAEVDEPRIVHVKVYELVKKSKTQDMASLGRALEAMQDFVRWAERVAPTGEKRAWVESPLVGRGGVTTTMKQALVGGIIRAVLVTAGFEVRDVNVSSWKKIVCGNGHAQKPAVMTAVGQLWPKAKTLIGDDQDLADAAAIVLFSKRVRDSEPPVRRPTKSPRRAVQGDALRPVVRRARLRG